MSDRKLDHIRLTNDAQSNSGLINNSFDYEPLLSAHRDLDISKDFLGKKIDAPLWISSMTGGTGEAAYINQNLSKVAGKHNIGLGLGSCRPLLTSNEFFEDFNLKANLNGAPFWANLGIAQIDELLTQSKVELVSGLCESLGVDGLIIHVNPLQEWFQPEGDRFLRSPIEIIEDFLNTSQIPVIVKEVGQGMGPRSLKRLMSLPIEAIEFAAFGGTNFSKLEMLRNEKISSVHECLANVGHNAMQMVEMSNKIILENESTIKCRNFIISGGIRDYLFGLELVQRSLGNCVFAMASPFLNYASKSEQELDQFVSEIIKGLKVASSFLHLKDRE